MIDDSSKDLFRGKIIACQAQWIDRKSIGKSTKLSLFRYQVSSGLLDTQPIPLKDT